MCYNHLGRVSVAVTYANEHEQRLKSRRPFSRHAAHLVANNYDPPKAWNDRIDAGPPFNLPVPRPALGSYSNFGACKKQHHVHVATRPNRGALSLLCYNHLGHKSNFHMEQNKKKKKKINVTLCSSPLHNQFTGWLSWSDHQVKNRVV